MGDINNDSSIDTLDIDVLQSFLLGRTIQSNTFLDRSDMNHDGTINVFDLILLKRTAIGKYEPEFIGAYPQPEGNLIEATVNAFGAATPATGNAGMLAVYVDFQDKTYS